MKRLVLALALLVASCAHERPKPVLAPPPRLPEPKRVERTPPSPEWFWETVEADVPTGALRNPELPASDVTRLEGAARIWDELGESGRARLAKDGIVVLGDPTAARLQMGVFYTELREGRVPYVVTLDALFYAVHLGWERALADVEDSQLAPALGTFLARASARLAAEQKGVPIETVDGLRIARGLVAVGASLLDRGAKIDPELAAVVGQELARIDAHEKRDVSPLLGVPIDYSAFAPPATSARPDAWKALTWLAGAPLLLVGAGEAPATTLSLTTVRTHARAAMILARLVGDDGDPEVREAWQRVARLLAFVWGAPDDVSLGEIAEAAATQGVALANPAHVASVTKVDRVRKRAMLLRVPMLFDGSAAPGRAGTSVRVFGGASPPDSVALAGLIAPHVGPPSQGDAPPRSIPQTLDIAVWLGAPEARGILHESGGDAYDGYDAALDKVTVPPEDALHASAHGSILAAIGASLHVPRASHAQEAAAIESALAAWTWLRHDGRPFSRPKPKSAPRAPKEMRVTGAPLAAWVEPAPEVVARLLGAVKQLERGLAARGPLDASTSGMTTLTEIEDILRGAQKIAEDELRGDLDDADRSALAALPARLQALETEDATTAVPVVVEVASDAAHGGPILESATGLVEPAALLLKETRSGRVVLAVGAHVAQHEISAASANRDGDASLRDRLATTPLPRPHYVTRFHP